jgi:hypothetical protein
LDYGQPLRILPVLVSSRQERFDGLSVYAAGSYAPLVFASNL